MSSLSEKRGFNVAKTYKNTVFSASFYRFLTETCNYESVSFIGNLEFPAVVGNGGWELFGIGRAGI